MHSLFKLLLLCALTFHAANLETEDLTSKCGTVQAKITGYEIEYDGGTLSGYYKIAADFLDFLHLGSIPYGALEALFGPESQKHEMSKWEIILKQAGFFIAVLLGLIFIIFVPICGLIFCYCRCCGLCGGKLYQAKPEEPKCYWLYGLTILCYILLIVGTVLFVLSTKEVLYSAESTGEFVVTEATLLVEFVSQVAIDLACEVVDLFFGAVGDAWELLLSLGTTVVDTLNSMTGIGSTVDMLVQMVNAEAVLKELDNDLQVLYNATTALNETIALLDVQLGTIAVSVASKELSLYIKGVENVKPTLDYARKNLDKIMKPEVSSLIEKTRDFFINVIEDLQDEVIERVMKLAKIAESTLDEVEERLTNLTENVEEQVEEAIETIVENIDEEVHEASGQIEKAVHKGAGAAGGLIEQGSEKLNETSGLATSGAELLKAKSKLAGKATQQLIQQGKEGVTGAQGQAQSLGEKLSAAAKQGESQAHNVVEQSQGVAEENAKEELGQVSSNINNIISNSSKDFGVMPAKLAAEGDNILHRRKRQNQLNEIEPNVPRTGAPLADQIPEAAKGKIQSKITDASSMLTNYSKEGQEKLHNVISAPDQAAQGLINEAAQGAHGEISSFAKPLEKNLQDASKNGTQFLANKAQWLLDQAANQAANVASGEASEQIGSLAVPFAENLENQAQEGLRMGTQLASNLSEAEIQQQLEQVAETLIETPEKLAHEKVDELAEKARNFTHDVAEKAEEIIDDAVDKAVNLTQEGLELFNRTFNKVEEIADGLIESLNLLILENQQKINTTYHNILNEISSSYNSLVDINETLDQISSKVESTLLNVQVNVKNDTLSFVQKIDKDIKEFFSKYVNDLYIIPGLVIIIPICLALLCLCCGLCCGTVGYRRYRHPTRRTCISHKGGNCLICSMCWLFFISAGYMIFTVVFFVLGYVLELYCYPLFFDENLEAYDMFTNWTGVVTIDNDTSYKVDFRNILETCKNDQGAYIALGLDRILEPELEKLYEELDSVLNKIPVEAIDKLITPHLVFQIPDWINDTLFDLISPFEQLSESLAKNTSFLTKQPTETPEIVEEFLTYLPVLDGNSSALDTLQSYGGNLSMFLNTLYETLNKTQISITKAQFVLEVLVSDLAETTRHKDAHEIAELTKAEVTSILDSVQNILGNYMVQLHSELKYDLGKCRPAYDFWMNVGTLICKQFGFPLHGMWFAMGWVTLFFIPLIILNVRLAKYFRRMKIKYYPEYLDEPFEGDYGYGFDDPPPPYDEITGTHIYGQYPHTVVVEELQKERQLPTEPVDGPAEFGKEPTDIEPGAPSSEEELGVVPDFESSEALSTIPEEPEEHDESVLSPIPAQPGEETEGSTIGTIPEEPPEDVQETGALSESNTGEPETTDTSGIPQEPAEEPIEGTGSVSSASAALEQPPEESEGTAGNTVPEHFTGEPEETASSAVPEQEPEGAASGAVSEQPIKELVSDTSLETAEKAAESAASTPGV